jgi:dihydroorotate dehydrogenase (NAD+) catalytic subunit
VGTANFVNPGSTIQIIDGMAAWLRENGMDSVKQLIGTLVVENEE